MKRLQLLTLALIAAGCAPPMRAPDLAADSSAAPPADVVAYYVEIAFGAEYRAPVDHLRTWMGRPVRVRMLGNAAPSDTAALDRTIADINAITGREAVSRVDTEANVDMHFVGAEDFARMAPPYAAKNRGYFYISWDRKYRITSGRILIRGDMPSADAREHTIREELTQVLGLSNDSWKIPASIFYQGASNVTRYATIDSAVIRLHERLRMHAGASQREVRDMLR
jgi:hypothetical protein